MSSAELVQTQYFDHLRELIEDTFSSQSNSKVTLLIHSMGALVSHYFLTTFVTETWKHTYLEQLVTLGGVWAGCSKALHSLVSGDTDQIFKFSSRLYIRPIERSFPSDYWMLPIPSSATWNKSIVLVTTPTRNYTAYNMKELVRDLNYPNGDLMYGGVANAMPHPLSPPNVTTHCIYGNSLKTEEGFHFGRLNGFPNGRPEVSYSLGDGTVSLRSLRVCRQWAGHQSMPVKWYEIKGAEHFGMLDDENILKLVEQLIITN